MAHDEGKEGSLALMDQGTLGEEPSETNLERVNGLDMLCRKLPHNDRSNSTAVGRCTANTRITPPLASIRREG